jgi:light-regulated signal transduction histidine kinase (bacteriophytochrome)
MQLVQLFQHLIANAIKFRGEGELVVSVGAERCGREWKFWVRDNGIGIHDRYLNKIFVVFQRLHNPGRYPGTGIGLSICKKIVENHSGQIWADSELGQGSTFYFTLPDTESLGAVVSQ